MECEVKRIITYICLLFIILIGVTFAYLNAEPVVINYYIAKVSLPLSLSLVLTLLLGCLLGLIACLCLYLKQRRLLSQCRKRADIAEKELANLRTMPLKDNC